jgi:tetratricopeptide (TPR) repeat protein
MKAIIPIFVIVFITACHFDLKVKKKYELYFNETQYQQLQAGIDAYQKQDYKIADSLLTIVIDKSKDKFSISMPTELNPYYYRGHNSIEFKKYEQALSDFDHVTSDTTTNTDILLARTEAFKMLSQYDTTIALCNRLLNLNIDSSIILSQRGICYYQKGEFEKACSDLKTSKRLAKIDVSFLDKFMNDCK